MQDTMITLYKTDDSNDNDRKTKLANLAIALEQNKIKMIQMHLASEDIKRKSGKIENDIE